MESPPGYPLVNVAMEGSRHSGALSTGPLKRVGTLETVSRGRGTWVSVKLQSAPTCVLYLYSLAGTSRSLLFEGHCALHLNV